MKEVVVITNELLAGVANLYEDVDEIIVLSVHQLSQLCAYAYSSFNTEDNLHVGLPSTNLEWTRHYVFRIGYPNWLLAVPEGVEKGKAQITLKCQQARDRVLKEYKIIPEKTVIFCPYAKTTSMLPVSVWDRIVKEYQQRGYRVFTNVGPKELELKDTERLQISVDAVVGIVDAGCLVVGVQSGLIDALTGTEMRRKIYVILNAQTEQDKTWMINNQNKNIEGADYMLFQGQNEETLIEEIEKRLFK